LISEVIGVDFSCSIPDVMWDRIITLLQSPSILRRKKKKNGSPGMDDTKAMSAIFYILRTAVSGMLYLEVFVLLVLYMMDSRSGGKQVDSGVCGSTDCQYTIELIE
jgi:hypothetical protein